ncbi:putative serine carboxypeptidase-like 53 [Capsicum annuum]|uniref:Serine carboxypeptidase-like 53 n=1 Tax=Capsicum annuum TaxID=4072 RepID=A0A2G3AKG0_CAPAN|nr:putative serine carboxypeptidase-like 53 [Capsicum annuum]PHT94725.1 putative serine carboxypeptidase-like 53 [Capsicum annuum]
MLSHINGGDIRTQSEVLGQFYKAKWFQNSNIDKSHFNASHLDIASNKKIVIYDQEGLKEKDKIHKLPGQPPVRFEQYGGYVTVDESAGRAFYYYFVEAQRSKESLPLLLWLNGGPGCSSLGYGAFQELGPFRIGNAVINHETDARGIFEYFASHTLMSDEDEAELQKKCKFTGSKESAKCQAAIDKAYDSLKLNIFAICAPICLNTNLTAKPNKPSKALHANVTNIQYTANWQPCSGDTDARLPVTSTKKSIKTMNLPIKTPWHPWLLNGEVGGYTQEYKGDMTFATVRGAGHQVPSYEAARALSLVMHFLDGTVGLPDS